MGKVVKIVEQFDVELYRESLKNKLEELGANYQLHKDSSEGVLINIERCALLWALELTYSNDVKSIRKKD